MDFCAFNNFPNGNNKLFISKRRTALRNTVVRLSNNIATGPGGNFWHEQQVYLSIIFYYAL